MSTPVITGRSKYSDSTDILAMSDGSTLYACSWPGCSFSAPTALSVPAHFKAHTGKAAQRRRGERRIKGTDAFERLTEILVAINDHSKDGMDLLDAVADELRALQELVDQHREKADRWDQLVELMDRG